MINDLFSLKGKVIVITGAAGLLGKKHAEAIAAFGGIPILLDLSQGVVEDIANSLIQKFSIEAKGFKVDITNELEVEKNAKLIFKQFGRIDGLVNNAANNSEDGKGKGDNSSRLEEFPIAVWNKDIAVGLTGAFICSKYYGYFISQNPDGGSIVNISSDLGIIAPDQRLYAKLGISEDMQPVKPITYSVIKTGIIGLTRYLATYWPEKNVRCNAICPGGIDSGQPEAFVNELSSRIPMNRMAREDEYQGTLIWMLSNASSYLNGAVISVDGGRTAW